MSTFCGFFNSDETGDRAYDAEKMSQMMDGVISEGVFPNIGGKLNVSPNDDSTVKIASGKAWFHSKWFLNKDDYIIDCGTYDNATYSRKDLIVIEINETESVRDGYFKVINGIPSATPEIPAIVNEGGIYQLPIAVILREPGETDIDDNHITNLVGTELSPWADTLLDPNRALYAYAGEGEDYPGGRYEAGTVEFKKENFRQSTKYADYYRAGIIVRPTIPFSNDAVVLSKTILGPDVPPNIILGYSSYSKDANEIYLEMYIQNDYYNRMKTDATIHFSFIAIESTVRQEVE